MLIETVSEQTFAKVLPLIAEYQRFYQAEPNPERNQAHFSQFIQNHSQGIQFVALNEQAEALGFATLYFPFSSVSAGQYCLLNDLFVSSTVRGGGIGRALIEHSLHYAQSRGFAKLQWTTQQHNSQAQRLYDSLTQQKSAWFHYGLSVSE